MVTKQDMIDKAKEIYKIDTMTIDDKIVRIIGLFDLWKRYTDLRDQFNDIETQLNEALLQTV